ncbi:stage V sporulation protein D [Desulfofarcimen acetoxidans DSM 771]|uniref:Stage V sporulation protein D n=1 Tax=Desulfofarcimen acetoxidans (strain ATCC 49208 / DSM 771 / KCTC 5769 / VKM B-1644 / 5575) TaxID=485916 RepID=C8W466_DESAS|nr:stage V sporulation protein D [Desulfofarcimen acetoxidans]ACV61934.1 stage V sporulation protein D [Desulfofarcimen acetoxidans DSM 771]
MRTTNITVRKRITILFLLIAAFLLFLIFRLAWLQFVKGGDLSRKSFEMRTTDVPVEAKRGSVYDRNGNELVTSISTDSVYAIPKQIEKPAEVAKKLAPYLKMDEEKIYKILTKKSAFEWVSRKRIDFEASQELKKMKLQGIGFAEESRRYYLHDTLAPQVLGFTGIDNQGLMGIEKAYDQELKGVPGRVVVEHDAAGNTVPQAMHKYYAPRQGHNIILTIDQSIQYFVERELDKVVSEYSPKNAVIVVMNPKTAEILAMGCRPTFNSNDWSSAPQTSWDRNPAIWYNYEPGSTFKIITMSAALEEGTVKESDTFNDPGFIKVADRIIKCWKAGGHGFETFADVVANSCNPGFIEVGLELGKERFYKYIKAFGFGELTNLNLPGEANGILIPEEKATTLNLATISIGQSVAVTPIQLITAVCGAVNGGTLMKPQLVKSITDSEGKVVKTFEPEKIRQVISKATSQEVRHLLEGVVMNGSGANAFVEGYGTGGKTGTAQVVGERGGYVSGKYVASFVGFSPVDDPQVVCLVVVSEPQTTAYYGSQVATPIYKEVVQNTLRYMGVPERPGIKKPKDPLVFYEEPEIRVSVPNVVNYPLEQAQEVLRGRGLAFKTSGSGDMVGSQTPGGGAEVLNGTTVLLNLDAQEQKDPSVIIMPDLRGLSIKEAGNLLDKLGLKLESQGTGLAAEQSVAPGNKVTAGTVIKIDFAAPDE